MHLQNLAVYLSKISICNKHCQEKILLFEYRNEQMYEHSKSKKKFLNYFGLFGVKNENIDFQGPKPECKNSGCYLSIIVQKLLTIHF